MPALFEITTVGADGGCPDLCLIDEDGTECKLSGPAGPEDGIYLMPYCENGSKLPQFLVLH